MSNKMNYLGILRVMARNFRYMKGKRLQFLVGGVLGLGSLAVGFLIPYLYEQLMELVEAGAGYGEILGAIGPAFGVLVLLMPLVCLGSWWQKSSANFATANMQRKVFGHTMRLPVSALETDRADKVIRATANVRSATSMFTGYTMTMVFKLLVYFCGGFLVLLWLDWRYALLGVALSAVMFWAATWLNIRLRALEHKALSADASLGGVLMDLVGNLPVAKLFGLEETLSRKYSDAGEAAYHCRLSYKVMRGTTDGVLDFLSYSAQGFAILLGVWALGLAQDFPSLVYLASMFSLMLTGTRDLGNAVMFLQTTVVNAQRVEELLEQPLEADRQTSAQPDFSAYPAVEFSHVDFSYLPGKQVLHDICLTVEPGQMVAIVGGSGCGKTTFIKLLEGFYAADSGVEQSRLAGQALLHPPGRPTLQRDHRSERGSLPGQTGCRSGAGLLGPGLPVLGKRHSRWGRRLRSLRGPGTAGVHRPGLVPGRPGLPARRGHLLLRQRHREAAPAHHRHGAPGQDGVGHRPPAEHCAQRPQDRVHGAGAYPGDRHSRGAVGPRRWIRRAVP